MPEEAAHATNGGRPSARIQTAIMARITSGALQSGDRLGSERDLAAEFQVSRATVRQALTSLEHAAAIRRVPGRGGGTFVTGTKIERDLSRVLGVPALLRQQGLTAGSRVLSTGIVAAEPATATALGLSVDGLVIDIVRIRLADGEPISLDHARFPAARFPGLLELPLGGSIYELLEEHYGVQPGESVERIEAVTAQASEAAMLGVDLGSPLLSVIRTATDQDGTPFEYSHDLMRSDRFRIVVHAPGAGSTQLLKKVRA